MTDEERKAFLMSPDTMAERLRAPWVWRSGIVRGSYSLHPEREIESVNDPMFEVTVTPLLCAHLIEGGHAAALSVLPQAMPLIAAAPDLLEALSGLANAVAAEVDAKPGFGGSGHLLARLTDARVAIAKATDHKEG
jgi:hypothetical protein